MSSAEPRPATREAKKEWEAKHKQAVGEANFKAAKAKAGGLSVLEKTEDGQKWLRALVPKNDEEGAKLNESLNASLENPDVFKKEHYRAFRGLLDNAKTFYAEKRVKVYESVLTDETHGAEARKELCTLAGILDATFKQGYANIFETWIEVGDKDGLDTWTTWVNKESSRLNEDKEEMMADVTDMGKCFKDAYNEDLIQEYEAFFTKVAEETGGSFFRPPMKSPLRAIEKTAFRHDPRRRFKCDNVYDVLRGAISYPDMEGIKRGAEMICSSKDFTALKIKDRLTRGRETTSGWRDAMINGRFEDVDTHVVEIQLHHDKLVSIREDLGGHYLYSIYRSLVEALEVVFGDEKAQEMIDLHAPKASSGGQTAGPNQTIQEIDRLEAENNKLVADNKKLGEENIKLTTENDKLSADIKNLSADNSKLSADNSKLSADNSKLKTEIIELREKIHEQQGSSSSLAPSNDQWHVILLNWFREFTDESNHGSKFQPRYPKSKEDLLALTKIDLSGCNLKGPIPKELGQLQKLTNLQLQRNQLAGPIPKEIGQLQQLTWLNLKSNQLTGPIPKELGQLQQLKELYLYGNKLTVPENAPLDSDGDMSYGSNERVKNFLKCLSK